MWTLFRLGGWPMFFVVAFGVTALLTSFIYAIVPNERNEGFIKWMSRATLFSILTGTCADFAAVGNAVANGKFAPSDRLLIICEGFAESMSPGIMGFSFLALIALMSAVGKRRLDARRG